MGKGLDLAAEDKKRRTPLDVAAALGHTEILALFKKEGHSDQATAERERNKWGGVGQVFDDDLFD